MHEFETFVYLDVQKTGSSFISHLLDNFCSEKQIRFRKHGRGDRKYDPNKFYFISVRDPFDQYVSLYSHGCDGYGGVYQRLKTEGREDLYDSSWSGFKRWLRFVLRPGSAEILDTNYAASSSGTLCKLIGLQTYRFLELALRNSGDTLDACASKDDIRNAYNTQKLPSFVIRHETFNRDVEELLTTRLRDSISDLDGAMKLLRDGTKINASTRVDTFEPDPKVGQKVRDMLHEREWFLKEIFGY
jgi:hypothetical protein